MDKVKCKFTKKFIHEVSLQGKWNAELHDTIDDDGFPLFPDSEGGTVSADAMVRLADALAELLGEALTAKEGHRRFGKHNWRSTRAVWLTGTMGIEVSKVQTMARWASPVVTHYTRLPP